MDRLKPARRGRVFTLFLFALGLACVFASPTRRMGFGPGGGATYRGVAVDFTSGALSSHLSGTGTSHSIVQPNLFEASWTLNESYYGFTQTVNHDREIYVKMQMKFGTNFDFGQGQKIMRVRSFNGSTNDWDFIAQITSVGNSNPGQDGTNESYQLTFSRNSGNTWGVVNKTFIREQWYTFQYRYFLNSAHGVADGVFQIWLDGVLIASYTSLSMVEGGAVYNRTINRVLWGGWYSNGAGSNPDPNPEPGPNTLQFRNCFFGTRYMP